MPEHVLPSVAAYHTLVGRDLGPGDWVEVTQSQIDAFADATDDHQWIHVDPSRAQAGPFGATIAHGYLTLALLPTLTNALLRIEGARMGINYGLNRVRFPAPVRAGARIRALVTVLSVEDRADAIEVVERVTIEIEGQDKPACVAETVSRYMS